MDHQRSRALRIAAVVLILLPLPMAEAAVSEVGSFELRGPLKLPSTSSLQSDAALALYLGATGDSDFVLSASTMRVRVFETEAITLSTAVEHVVRMSEYSWDLHGVDVELASGGDHAGEVGLFPHRGGTISISPTEPTDVHSREVSTIPGEFYSAGDSTRGSYYSREIRQPHLYMETPGLAIYAGGGYIKIRGFDVRIVADENTTVWRTGYEQRSPVERVTRWLLIEADDMELKLDSPDHPLIAAAADGTIAWDGEARMVATKGEIRTKHGSHRATGEPASLDGRFEGILSPLGDSSATLSLAHAEVRASTLQFVPAPRGPFDTPPAFSWLSIALIAIVIGGSGIALLAKRRRPTARAYASYEERAEEAADAREYRLASDLFAKARSVEPDRGGLADRHGMVLLAMGEVTSALRAFDVASYSTSSGRPERMAAYCALRLGDADKAQYYLLRAVERTPYASLLDEIETDAAFAEIVKSPEGQEALDIARIRTATRSLDPL